MRTHTVENVRHISVIGPYDTDMLSGITEANAVVVDTDRVVLLMVSDVALVDLQQLGLVMTEAILANLAILANPVHDHPN